MYSKLKGLMVEKNITQVELAQILKISASALNYKINGRTDFSVTEAKSISSFFGTTVEELFVFNEIKKAKAVRDA